MGEKGNGVRLSFYAEILLLKHFLKITMTDRLSTSAPTTRASSIRPPTSNGSSSAVDKKDKKAATANRDYLNPLVTEVADLAKTIIRKEIAIDNPWPTDRTLSTWNTIVTAATKSGNSVPGLL